MSVSGWIGVDLDGTLAHYAGWKGADSIGEPIMPMVMRVKRWIKHGLDVRIVTARVAASGHVNADSVLDGSDFAAQQVTLIQKWCKTHLGKELPVTASKDFMMIELWDDRCVQVEMNTGAILGRELR